MRISTAYQFEQFQTDIDRTSQLYVNLQQQVATGRRIQQLSDDPYGVGSSISMRTLQSYTQQYNSNLATANGFLTTTDSALTESYNIMTNAYQLAVSGANSTTDQSGRDAMVTQITGLEKRLVDLGNSQGPDGQYVFAGQQTTTKPFSVDAKGNLVYAGDSNTITVQGSASDTVTSNVPGNKVFTDLYQKLESLKADLSAGNTSKVSNTDIADLKSSMDSLNNVRGDIGARLQTVQQLTTYNTKRITDLTSGISNVEDVDMASAITQMTAAQTAYQAALTVTAQANKFSLVDFIQ